MEISDDKAAWLKEIITFYDDANDALLANTDPDKYRELEISKACYGDMVVDGLKEVLGIEIIKD